MLIIVLQNCKAFNIGSPESQMFSRCIWEALLVPNLRVTLNRGHHRFCSHVRHVSGSILIYAINTNYRLVINIDVRLLSSNQLSVFLGEPLYSLNGLFVVASLYWHFTCTVQMSVVDSFSTNIVPVASSFLDLKYCTYSGVVKISIARQ